MSFTIFDFLIGFFLMNAMPHLLFGLFEIRMISLFGFGRNANLAYATFNMTMTLLIYHVQYGIETLTDSGILLGAGFILLMYVLTGRFFYNLFRSDGRSHEPA